MRAFAVVACVCALSPVAVACPDGTKAVKTKLGASWCALPDGTRHGPAELVYPTGEVKARGSYDHGKLEGEWSQYYRDGKPWTRQRFEAGLLVGAASAWFPGEVAEYELHYARGQAAGDFARHDASGRLVQEGRFDHGALAGTWTTYDPWSGLARSILIYFDGARCYFARYLDEGGNADYVRRRTWYGSHVVGPSDCQAKWDAAGAGTP